MDQLIAGLNTLVKSVNKLHDTVRSDMRDRKRQETRMAIALILVLVISVVQVVQLIEADAARKRIADCETEGGECFERNEARVDAVIREAICLIDEGARERAVILFPGTVLPDRIDGCEEILTSAGG